MYINAVRPRDQADFPGMQASAYYLFFTTDAVNGF